LRHPTRWVGSTTKIQNDHHQGGQKCFFHFFSPFGTVNCTFLKNCYATAIISPLRFFHLTAYYKPKSKKSQYIAVHHPKSNFALVDLSFKI